MYLKCSILLLLLTSVMLSQSSRSHGWNNRIKWKTLDDAFTSAKMSQKNVMLLVHRSSCPACHSLKPKFAGSKTIKSRSSLFEMVKINTDEQSEPRGSKFAPDGAYVPRIMFYSPAGDLRPELHNAKASADTKYFYHDAPSIERVMNLALEI